MKNSKINKKDKIRASGTSHNKRLTLRRPFGRLRVSVRLGHSATLHSHGSLQPHFTSPGLATQALIRAGKTSST